MELSSKKQKWVVSHAKSLQGVIVGKDTGHNRKADYYYKIALDKEFNKYIKSFIGELERVYGVLRVNNAKTAKASLSQVLTVIKAYKGAKLKILFKNARKIVEKWLRMASRESDRKIRKVLQDMAGKEIAISYDKTYDDTLKLMIERNVQLITNVSSQTITNIENIVYDGMTTGEGWSAISKGLKHQSEIADKRIKLIARDQTAKTNQALNELQQREAGIKYFMWRTMQDERVSTGYGGHKQLNGKIYKWGDVSNYPIIDSYGHRGLPSVRPNCRCVSLPLFVLKGYKAEKLNDGSYKIERGGYI